MEKFKTPITENILITPERAKQLLETQNGNRHLNKNRVELYANEMRTGRWRLNGESIKIDWTGRLIDGQHRLAAVVLADTPIWFTITSRINPDCFATLDSGQTRTTAQVFTIAKIENAAIASTVVWRTKELQKTGYYSNGGNAAAAHCGTKENILKIYNSDVEGYKEAAKIARSLYDKLRLFSPAFIGAVYYYLTTTLHYDKNYVLRFFNAVHGQGQPINQAEALKNKIIKRKLEVGTHLKDEYLFNLFVKAWNKYVLSEPIKTLTYSPEQEGEQQLMSNPHYCRMF